MLSAIKIGSNFVKWSSAALRKSHRGVRNSILSDAVYDLLYFNKTIQIYSVQGNYKVIFVYFLTSKKSHLLNGVHDVRLGYEGQGWAKSTIFLF